MLTCQSKTDIENINLMATLLSHHQHVAYWKHLGCRFVADVEALLKRHLLQGILEVSWIHPASREIADDTQFFSTLQELMAYMMFAGVNDGSWSGLAIFVPAMALVAVTWWLASPFTIRHARIVQKIGEIMMWPFNALTEWWDPNSQLAEKDISPYFWPTAPCRSRPSMTRSSLKALRVLHYGSVAWSKRQGCSPTPN